MRRFFALSVLCALVCLPVQPASAQDGDAPQQQQDLYAFWVHAGAFSGTLDSESAVGLRLAANLGEATFLQVGGQMQTNGFIEGTSRAAVNVALGQSLMQEEFVLSAYAGPLVASSDGDEADFGALAAVRADWRLFWGVGLGAELQASWAAGYLSGNGGLYLTFGGFER